MDKSQIYAQVYAVITTLGGQYLRKTPKRLLDLFADSRDKDYAVKINPDMPLQEQNLSDEALSILAMLKLDYWSDNIAEKEHLKCILTQDKKDNLTLINAIRPTGNISQPQKPIFKKHP